MTEFILCEENINCSLHRGEKPLVCCSHTENVLLFVLVGINHHQHALQCTSLGLCVIITEKKMRKDTVGEMRRGLMMIV